MTKIKYLDLLKITQSYEPELSKSIDKVVRSGWFLLGSEVSLFEKKFARFCGVSHCIGVGNGLDALKIILMAYKQMYHWEENSEIIVPAHTFIASAESIVQSGLKPVFCDVSLDDYLLDHKKIEPLISSNTRAIICVHLYGKLCKLSKISQIAKKYNLKIIEDAAQAHGARDEIGRRAGNLGDAAAFSFYPGKNLGALGDAGAILTNDDNLATTCRQIANYGQSRKYYHDFQGVNSRMDEIQAAILIIKLQRLDDDNNKRQQMAEYYFENIHNPLIKLPYKNKYTIDSVYHIFPIFSKNRDKLQQYLSNNGIETIIHYPIIPSKQRAFKEFSNQQFKNAERIACQELSIPLHPFLKQEEIEYIVRTLNLFTC